MVDAALYTIVCDRNGVAKLFVPVVYIAAPLSIEGGPKNVRKVWPGAESDADQIASCNIERSRMPFARCCRVDAWDGAGRA